MVLWKIVYERQRTLNQVVDCNLSAQGRNKGGCFYNFLSLYMNLLRVLEVMLVRNVVTTG